MTSLYNRADVYDLRFNQQGWDIFREHYRNIFAGTDIRTVLDCSIGSGNLTLELAELGYRVRLRSERVHAVKVPGKGGEARPCGGAVPFRLSGN